jgi:hypothetical protein
MWSKGNSVILVLAHTMAYRAIRIGVGLTSSRIASASCKKSIKLLPKKAAF